MNVTKPGPQPLLCIIDDCEKPQAGGGEVYCKGHLKYFASRNGTSADPPIMEPDDPALLESEARKAAIQEQVEYAERRRVKTWKTLENGSRVPETFWTEEELAKMEKEAERVVLQIHTGDGPSMTREEFAERQARSSPSVGPPDMTAMEPQWDGAQWVLRPKSPDVDLNAVRSLVRDLMMELGIREAGGNDHA